MFKQSTFSGGYSFCKLQGTPRADIQNIPIPHQITIPLKQGFGESVLPIVKIGEHVVAGQVIGQNNAAISTPVIASANGVVQSICEVPHLGKNIQAIVIETDRSENYQSIAESNKNWQSLSIETIADILHKSGVAGLGATGLPTFAQTSTISAKDVKYLVIAALSTYPMALPTIASCDNRLEDAAQGIAILRKLYQNPPTFVGFSKNENEVGKTLRSVLNTKNSDNQCCSHCNCDAQNNIVIRDLKSKYPQEMPEIITETLTKCKVPDGKMPDAIGAVVLDLADALAVYDAVALGKPLLQKVVSLSGTGFKDNLALRVRIGMSLSEIFEQWTKKNVEVRYIHGHALLGDLVHPNMSVVSSTKCLTCLEENRHRQFMFFMRPGFRTDSYSNVFASSFLGTEKKVETNLHGELRPCIHCSYCEEVCPRPLYPHLLHKYCTNNLADDALNTLKLQACIECGLCTYICPSKIEVMSDIQKGKEELRKAGLI